MTEYELKKRDPMKIDNFLDLCGTCSQYSNDAVFDGSGNTLELDVDGLDSLVNIAYNT
tara:strand:- start:1022 stop:1195 length:174 start_codon:yes stop_codon:yes gene_type:complete